MVSTLNYEQHMLQEILAHNLAHAMLRAYWHVQTFATFLSVSGDQTQDLFCVDFPVEG